MKIRHSSRITAIVLALMMIVPLISVPAVAATKVDGTKAEAVVSNDFESYEDGANAAGNGLVSGPSNAVIATLDGNKVIKYDLTPDSTHKDGAMFIKGNYNQSGVKRDKDVWFVANVTSYDFDENDNIVYSGNVDIWGTTYYFQNAILNDDGAVTACSLYKDEACTEEHTSDTYHLCTARVRNAIQGQTNIAVPSYVEGTKDSLAGNTFVLQADYYFDTDIANQTFDFRMQGNNGDIHFGQFITSTSGVKIRLHTDLKTGILYDPQPTFAKGEWITVTVIVSSDNSKSTITMYANGQLIGHATQDRAFSSFKAGWNLGHVARGSNVSAYYGTYYIDNVAVYNTTDVIPTDWEKYDPNKLCNENFEGSALGTAIPATIAYGGTTKEIVSFNGSKMLKLDFGAAGNLDKPVTIQGCAVSDGILQISTDFYIPSDVNYQYQGQISSVTADGALTAGGEVTNTNLGATWIDLYFLQVQNGAAKIRTFGDGRQDKVVYSDAIPVNKQFNLSVYIDMASGVMNIVLDGVVICTTYLFRTVKVDNVNTNFYLSNIRIAASKILVGKLNKLSTSGMSAYNGDLYIDNIKVAKVDAMPKPTAGSASHDFEDKTVGDAAPAPSNRPTAGPSTAKYENLTGSNVVAISLLGQTEATELEIPFISTNARSYDITTSVESFVAPAEVTLDFLNSLTFTGSISNPANDKPIYYAYVAAENTVYVYNNNGNAATEANVGGFKLEKYEITDANYNGMFRAMCGGQDSNIDKNFRVSHPALAIEGTYVMSADYFVANDASGSIQSQFYCSGLWIDLYQFDLTNKEFKALNATIADEGTAKLIVDEWNTVTMIVNVAEDLTTTADVYLNGVYCFSKSISKAIEADSWILVKIAKPSIAVAQQMAGMIYLDNVKVNAEKYDAEKLDVIDASKVMGFDIDGKTGIINVSKSTELKIYADSYTAYGQDLLNLRVGNIVSTTDKASVRLVGLGRSGLRFATQIDAATLSFLDEMIAQGMIKSYNFGTLIAPTDYLSAEKELSFENFTEDVDMLDVEAIVGQYYEVDEDAWTTHFVGSIVDINTWNYDRAFTGRGYFQVTLTNGEVITYYSATTKSISIAEQAQLTIDAGVYEVGSAEYETLVGYAGPQA